jgi:hypothetical protein
MVRWFPSGHECWRGTARDAYGDRIAGCGCTEQGDEREQFQCDKWAGSAATSSVALGRAEKIANGRHDIEVSPG